MIVRLIAGFACCAISFAQAPSFTAAGVVNAATNQPVLAPYTICTIYGTNLYLNGTAWASGRSEVPDSLAGISVLVGATRAGVLYVSAGQINFLIPNSLRPSSYTIRVVRDGLASPAIPIEVQEASPGIFAMTHQDGSPITNDSPAVPGEVVIIYATGLGRTQPDPSDRALATKAAPIVHLPDLQVSFDGAVLDPSFVLYAGLTPGNAGLYQINLRIPDTAGANPELRVGVAGVLSAPGVRLALQPRTE